MSNGVFAIAIGMVGPTLLAHGTDDQKRRYLRPMLKGDEVWCQPFSEPEAGSDLAAIATRAAATATSGSSPGRRSGRRPPIEPSGDPPPRTDPDVPKHKGITYFLVDMPRRASTSGRCGR